MQKVLFGLAVSAFLFSTAAHADAISERQAIMKNVNGASIGFLVKTAKGEVDYDPAAVLAAFEKMRDGNKDFLALFPADSMTGGDTTASPKIWEDMAGFKAAHDKFEADLEAAVAAAPQDKAAFMPVFKQVADNCAACHQVYRIQKN